MYHPKELTPEELEAKRQTERERRKQRKGKHKEKEARTRRREGRTVDKTDVVAMARTVKKWEGRARQVAQFDKAKLNDWQAFVLAFDNLWEGSAYLPQAESRILNDLQKPIESARVLFKRLEKETLSP